MNKYFIEILKIKNSVIIPGLGSLMIANPKTGKIVLSPHIKFDDGTLVNFIAEKEGIDKVEAKNKVSKFVREIEAELDKGETYDIYQFGTISKNDKGEPSFTMDDSLLKSDNVIAPKSENSKAEVKETKPVKEEKKEKPEEKKKSEDKVKKETPKNIYIPPTETPSTEKEEVKEVKKEAPKKTVNEKLAEAQKSDLKNDKKVEKITAKKEKVVVKEKEEKKKRRLMPIILLLITLGAIAFGGYMFKDDIKKSLGMGTEASHDNNDEHGEAGELHEESESDHETISTENVNEMDSTAVNEEMASTEVGEETETVVDEEPVKEEVVETTPPVSTSVNGSFHIIGGGFSEESNATNYAAKVGGTVLGRFDKLYLVAIKSYNSMADAKADLSNVKNTEPSAWIFEYAK